MIHFRKADYLLLTVFILTGFSLYFLNYFEPLKSLGNVLKLCSILCLLAGLYSRKIFINSFDTYYLFVMAFIGAVYTIATIRYGISDLMFINFISFSVCYILLSAENAKEKIIYSYKVLCCLMTMQVCADLIAFKILKFTALWPGGSFVGGMGNPSSFGFTCNFCLAFLLFYRNQFHPIMRAFFILVMVAGILLSNALFMVLLMGFSFTVAIMKSNGILGKIIFFLGGAFASLISGAYLLSTGGLLAAKIQAVLANLGLAEAVASSDSVDLRKEIFADALDFLSQPGLKFLWGQYKNLSYFDVDSQYITYFFSFGLTGLMLFTVLLLMLLLRAVFIRNEIKTFILVTLILFLMTFFNNRILDYFPVGYLFVSLVALISSSEREFSVV